MPLFAITPERPTIGEFKLTILDIGQGTAAVVQTANHTLVYDTGPKWTDNSDAGSRLIAPYLRAAGSAHIHGMVVSHLDIDHSGGARSLLNSVPVDWMLTSVFAEAGIVTTAQQRGVKALACAAGQTWTWDGVRFDVLHPDADNYSDAKLKTNDRSCVVKVSAQSFSILLTADVEVKSEAGIIERYAAHPEALKSDVLMMPHHGSLTSSTPEFIDAVAPKLAVINAGYRNRFGHPRDGVLSRYVERNIPVLRTDLHGAISIESAQGLASARKERDTRQRYWVDRPDSSDRRAIE